MISAPPPRQELHAKKSWSNLRSTTPTPADPHSLRGTIASGAPSSSGKQGEGVGFEVLERSVVGDASGQLAVASGSAKGKGFSKLFGSWGKGGEKKSAGVITSSMPTGPRQVTQSMPSVLLPPAGPPYASRTVNYPVASVSLPSGFPSPPPRTRVPPPAFPLPLPPAQSAAKQHAATAFMSPPQRLPSSQSMSTMSTMSSSSFASTCASTDDWESSSEATTHRASSPEGSPRYIVEDAPQQRMWRVNGLASHEVPARSTSKGDRNSTPIPSHLLPEPSTPPRMKRNSASSHPSPGSPPFDPLADKGTRVLRELNGFPSSPDQSGDADDEVSPPRVKVQRGKKDYLSASEIAYTNGTGSRIRIPSIRFEGISMDAVFAEVEKKMRDELESGGRVEDANEGGSGIKVVGPEGGMTKRRTRVFSMYRPMSTFDEEPAPTTIVASTSTTSSIGSNGSKSSGHVNRPLRLVESLKSSTASPTIAAPSTIRTLDLARPRPAPPRRNSSRPSPVNVAAANAVIAREFRAKSATSPSSYSSSSPTVSSPPLSGAFPLLSRPLRNDLFSPRDSQFSPGLPPSSVPIPASPGLGEAFAPHPSPALSTTSTLRGIDLPEVCVLPPTPTPDDGDWVQPVYHRENRAMSRVVVLEEKRTVKVSSRASAMMRRPVERKVWVPVPAEMEDAEEDGEGHEEEEATTTPPLSPAVSASSSISSIGVDSPTPGQAFYDASVLEPPSPSPLAGGGLGKPYSGGSDEDPSDAEEAIAHLLTLLHSARSPAPSTPLPPSPPEASTSFLTSSALRLHTHKTSSPLSSSSSGSTLAERRRLSSAYGGTAAGSMMYESDDSATRFGDAPLFLSSLALGPRPSGTLPHRGLAMSSTSSFNFGSKEVPVTITRSSSAASEVSSMSARPRRVRVLSGESDTGGSSASDSEGGYESLEGGDEVAEVMMGERVSCGYDIGVAM